MSEKGGKGLKSSLKSPNGVGKDSSKKKTRFHDERPAEDGFKPVQESDYHFQGVTTAKAGKGSKPKKSSPSQRPELNTEKELPENAKCMMDCEAFQYLQGIKEQLVVLSDDPSIKIPVSFDRGLEYLKYGSCYTNPDSVREILEPLKNHGVSEGEICMIANVCPESIDEVFAFVPSTKGQKDTISQPLQEALKKLSKIKRSS